MENPTVLIRQQDDIVLSCEGRSDQILEKASRAFSNLEPLTDFLDVLAFTAGKNVVRADGLEP